MMKVELSLYSPAEYRKFAEFCNDLAAVAENEQPPYGLVSDSVGAARVEAPVSEPVVAEPAVAQDTAEKPARKPRAKKEPEPVIVPETPAEVVAQDEADEVAETEANSTPDKELTYDDVRSILSAYVAKFGMDAAQADGPAILQDLFGPSITKVSQIPNDQNSLGKAVEKFQSVLETNPFKRAAVG